MLDIRQADVAEWNRATRSLTSVKKYFDILFERAPIMLHVVDKDFNLVKVNRQWLKKLGYKMEEVLGHKPFDFLTEGSRAYAIKDVIPLFQRAGADHAIALQLVKKDGRTLDVLLDAEVSPGISGSSFALAALRDSDDLKQWEQASTTINTLKQLSFAAHHIDRVLYPSPNTGDIPVIQHSAGGKPAVDLVVEGLGMVLEVGQNISANLRALFQVQEEWLDTATEQRCELLLTLQSVNKTLRELADAAEVKWKLEQPPEQSLGAPYK